jgi:peroxiredoxin
MTVLDRRSLIIAGAGLALFDPSARAAPGPTPRVGSPAPDFTATDSDGKPVTLSSLRGKLVVLEWTNDGCPFVQKWYGAGAMQALQREAAGLGAVWLSVISSAPGEQGAADGARANLLTAERKAAPAHVLLDPTGALGHLYDAQTTPHMFVVGKDGMLGYMGGADSVASTKPEDLPRAKPYVRNAIVALAAGQKVTDAVTRPYGCTVKYST